jgi:predicted amidohydrolase
MRLFISIFLLAAVHTSSLCAESELRVAVAQPLVVPGDVNGNIDRMASLIADASKREADVIVFSECAITGYDLNGVGAKAALASDSKALSRVEKLARKHRITIIAGFHESSDGKLFNTAGVFFPNGRRVYQRKSNVMDSERRFCPVHPGERKRECFTIKGFTCAILICADTGIAGIFDELAGEKCDAIITITAGAGDQNIGFHQNELKRPERLKKYLDTALACIGPDMIATTLRLNIAQVACNQCGWQSETGYFHPGGSIVVDHDGQTNAVIPPRFVFEHVKPELAIGVIHNRS